MLHDRPHTRRIVRSDEIQYPFKFLQLERRRKALLLELIQFGRVQETVLVDVGDFEDAAKRFRAFGFQDLHAGSVGVKWHPLRALSEDSRAPSNHTTAPSDATPPFARNKTPR